MRSDNTDDNCVDNPIDSPFNDIKTFTTMMSCSLNFPRSSTLEMRIHSHSTKSSSLHSVFNFHNPPHFIPPNNQPEKHSKIQLHPTRTACSIRKVANFRWKLFPNHSLPPSSSKRVIPPTTNRPRRQSTKYQSSS